MPPDFSREQNFLSIYPGCIVAGVDEAGRGPLAGPVIAAAVILNPHNVPPGIDDSKMLTAQKREILYAQLCSCAHISFGQASVAEIDEINILHASMLAMVRAVAGLPLPPTIVLVDGNRPPQLNCRVETIVRGDALSLSIAAASIIAKVTRDQIMAQLDAEFPGFSWKTNMGYGTRAHQDALRRLGRTPHHRTGFMPIRKMLCEESDITD